MQINYSIFYSAYIINRTTSYKLTSPAMNCPNPGGKVKVAIISVTTAGKSSRLGGKTKGKSKLCERKKHQ